MNFIELIQKSTDDAESPAQYYYWSGLAAISAVLKNSVYLDKYRYKLYPNIYALLVGDSGLRKGPPVNLAKRLVRGVGNNRVISGRGSIQGAMGRLSQVYTSPGGLILQDTTALLISEEFAAFLVDDPAGLKILTDLYDGHFHEGEYVGFLKSNPFELNNVCLTMLAASNETNLKEVIPQNSVGSGFVARTAVVYAKEARGINPLTSRPVNMIPEDDLIDYLKQVASLKGEFTYSTKGKQLYDKWYFDFRTATKGKSDPTGILNRIHDQVLKVAMLISVSRRLDLVIGEDDMQEALDACVGCVTGVKKITMGTGRSQVAPQTAIVLNYLMSLQGYRSTRQKVLQKFWGEMDAFDLDRIVETMSQAGAILVVRNGKHTIYQVQQHIVDQYQAYKTGDDL